LNQLAKRFGELLERRSLRRAMRAALLLLFFRRLELFSAQGISVAFVLANMVFVLVLNRFQVD